MLDELGSPAVAIESDIRNLPESTKKKKKEIFLNTVHKRQYQGFSCRL